MISEAQRFLRFPSRRSSSASPLSRRFLRFHPFPGDFFDFTASHFLRFHQLLNAKLPAACDSLYISIGELSRKFPGVTPFPSDFQRIGIGKDAVFPATSPYFRRSLRLYMIDAAYGAYFRTEAEEDAEGSIRKRKRKSRVKYELLFVFGHLNIVNSNYG
ncbi:hypothetical protein LXL04_022315 [Taraxacum kok-saghyz]